MIRTTAKSSIKQTLKAILAAAAMGLTATAANAQFGSYNTSNSFGLTRLGGPVVVADYSGYGGSGGGYGGFVNQSASFNNGFYGNMAAYNTPQNIAFNGNGTIGVGANGSFGGNQLINDPLTGFQQPRVIIDPLTGQAFSGPNSALNASANFNAQLAQFNANRAAQVNALTTGNATVTQQNGFTGNTGFNGNTGIANNGVTTSSNANVAAAAESNALQMSRFNNAGMRATGVGGSTASANGSVPYWTAANPMLDASAYANGLVYPNMNTANNGAVNGNRNVPYWTAVNPNLDAMGQMGTTMNSNAMVNGNGNVPYWTSVNSRLDTANGFRRNNTGFNGYAGYNAYYGNQMNGTYGNPGMNHQPVINGPISIGATRSFGNPGMNRAPVINGPISIGASRGR